MTDEAEPDEAEIVQTIQHLLFSAPLYAKFDLPWKTAYRMFVASLAVDGHCPYCQRAATFHRSGGEIDTERLTYRMEYYPAWHFQLSCTRNHKHHVVFFFHMDHQVIQKIGQYPSLADIVNDESRLYRKVLEPNDASELHKAIGLAAHGVGVGSLVYLRRAFERLIMRRFAEFRDIEGWSEAKFVSPTLPTRGEK